MRIQHSRRALLDSRDRPFIFGAPIFWTVDHEGYLLDPYSDLFDAWSHAAGEARLVGTPREVWRDDIGREELICVAYASGLLS